MKKTCISSGSGYIKCFVILIIIFFLSSSGKAQTFLSNQNGDTVFVEHPLIQEVFPGLEVLLISNHAKPPSFETMAKFRGNLYDMPQKYNILLSTIKESSMATTEDKLKLFAMMCFLSTNSTCEIAYYKNEFFHYDEVSYNYRLNILISNNNYEMHIKYTNNEIEIAYVFLNSDEINVYTPDKITSKTSRAIGLVIGGVAGQNNGGVMHYYAPVGGPVITFTFNGLDPTKPYFIRIKPVYGFPGILFLLQKLNVNAGGNAVVNWVPAVPAQTGICLVQLSSNGAMAFTSTERIVPENVINGVFANGGGIVGYAYKIYYTHQFFINHPNGPAHAPVFANMVKNALDWSWNDEVINWQLAQGCPGNRPSDADNIYEVAINGSMWGNDPPPETRMYHETIETAALGGAERIIGIGSRIWFNPIAKNYQPEDDAVSTAICHEFYHGIQWTLQNGWLGVTDEDWLIEGQARFIQTEFMIARGIAPNPPIGGEEYRINNLYWQDANDFLKAPDRSLTQVRYNYCIFWRFLFENYLPANPWPIIRETCRNCKPAVWPMPPPAPPAQNSYIVFIEDKMDAELAAGGGTYISLDWAIIDFAKKDYLNQPLYGLWNPCPPLFYNKPLISARIVIPPWVVPLTVNNSWGMRNNEMVLGAWWRGGRIRIVPPPAGAPSTKVLSCLFIGAGGAKVLEKNYIVVSGGGIIRDRIISPAPFNFIVIISIKIDDWGTKALYSDPIFEWENSTTWTGLVDNDWWNPSNWDNGKSPGINSNNDNVIIPASPNDPILGSGSVYVKDINIEGGNLTVAGGTLFINDSLSNSAGLTITNGNIKCSGALYTKPGSTFNVNGGTVDLAGWMRDENFDLAEGTINLTGGTVKVFGSVRFNTTAVVNQTGPFNMYIGGDYQVNNNTNTTDGTIYLTGGQNPGSNVVCQATNPSSGNDLYAWNLIINPVSPSTTAAFAMDDPGSVNNNIYIQNMLKVVNGTLSTYNGAGHASSLNVNGNFWVYNNANFQTDANTAVSINGDLKLWAGSSGYSSWIDAGNVSYVKNPQLDQVFITSSAWHMISPPVGSSIAGLFAGKFIQKHDETTNLWSDITLSSESLLPFTGYALYSNWTYSIPWKGNLNTGTYTASLTRNNAGWNAVGNPFPSPVDWDAPVGWTKTNVADAIYIENNGVWVTYINGVSTNGGSPYIAPGQGFFVECTSAGGGTLAVMNNARTHARAPFFKDAVANLIRLNVSGNDRTDETVIYFNENSTRAFDYDYDAHKMFAYLDEIPQIYSLDNGNMAINALPEADMVLLGFKAGVSGQYTIAATEINDIPHAILEELETGVRVDLRTSSYGFNYMVGEDEARFALHFMPNPLPAVPTEVVRIYSTGQDIYVNAPEGFTGDVFVYNLLGEIILQTRISNMLNKITVSNSGTYVVRVINPEVAVSGKLVVSK